MTARERAHPEILDGSRRRRIARGSGTQVADVNRLLKQREMIQKLYKQFGLGAAPGRKPVLPGLGRKLFGG
jgi:signal recognition particle subunit SRP54